MIATRSGDGLIEALAGLIKRLAVNRLHVVGDIFDRGPRADSIMDILMRHHAVDIEWGNHDILWMGAASGSEACIAAVVRNALAYGNMTILERGYGIPLRELTLFAEKTYPELPLDKALVHAIQVMMFKLEGQLIRRNPDFGLEDRLLLHKLNRSSYTVEMDGRVWDVKELPLPTVNPADPYALSPEEEAVMKGLRAAFTHSLRLHEHVSFLYERGWMYRAFNGNLLFHGCVPLNEDGSFPAQDSGGPGRSAAKPSWITATRWPARPSIKGDRYALDFMWYLWCGTDSPVCGRNVKTFARAFIADETPGMSPATPITPGTTKKKNAGRYWRNSASPARKAASSTAIPPSA